MCPLVFCVEVEAIDREPHVLEMISKSVPFQYKLNQVTGVVVEHNVGELFRRDGKSRNKKILEDEIRKQRYTTGTSER